MGLFTPKWKSKYPYVAEKAVGKLKTQQQLSTVLREAMHPRVLMAAIERATDQKALGEFVRTWRSADTKVQLAAFNKITDQSELAAIAIADKNRTTALYAIDKLQADEDLLRVATEGRSDTVRSIAAGRIKDEDIRYRLYKSNINVFRNLAGRFTKPCIISDIVKTKQYLPDMRDGIYKHILESNNEALISLLDDEICRQITERCLDELWRNENNNLTMLRLLYRAGKCGARVDQVKALHGKTFGKINNVTCGIHNDQPGYVFEL